MESGGLRKHKKVLLSYSKNIDYILDFPEEKTITVLQLTDIQTVDLTCTRNSIRYRQIRGAYFKDGITSMELRSYCDIRTLVEQVDPDLIVLTGDNIYGEFDDNGKMLLELINLMESFGRPWTPIFGNHDNESDMGVRWQIEQFLSAPHCLFAQGQVTGNSNYSILLTRGGIPAWGLIYLDTNGCHPIGNPKAPEEGIREGNRDFERITQVQGIYPDQIKWASDILDSIGVPSIGFFHIPIHAFDTACRQKYGYLPGIPMSATDSGDWGEVVERFSDKLDIDDDFFEAMHARNMRAMLVGHQHNNSALIEWKGVKLVWGVKTGRSTYYIPEKTGGTVISLFPDGKLNISPKYL